MCDENTISECAHAPIACSALSHAQDGEKEALVVLMQTLYTSEEAACVALESHRMKYFFQGMETYTCILLQQYNASCSQLTNMSSSEHGTRSAMHSGKVCITGDTKHWNLVRI